MKQVRDITDIKKISRLGYSKTTSTVMKSYFRIIPDLDIALQMILGAFAPNLFESIVNEITNHPEFGNNTRFIIDLTDCEFSSERWEYEESVATIETVLSRVPANSAVVVDPSLLEFVDHLDQSARNRLSLVRYFTTKFAAMEYLGIDMPLSS